MFVRVHAQRPRIREQLRGRTRKDERKERTNPFEPIGGCDYEFPQVRNTLRPDKLCLSYKFSIYSSTTTNSADYLLNSFQRVVIVKLHTRALVAPFPEVHTKIASDQDKEIEISSSNLERTKTPAPFASHFSETSRNGTKVYSKHFEQFGKSQKS